MRLPVNKLKPAHTRIALLAYLGATIERDFPSHKAVVYSQKLKRIFDGCVTLTLDDPSLPSRTRLANSAIAHATWQALDRACGPPGKRTDSIPSDGWYNREHVLRAIEAAMGDIAADAAVT